MQNEKMIDVFTKSIQFFESGKNTWCQNHYAEDKDGKEIDPHDLPNGAVSFCSSGIICYFTDCYSEESELSLLCQQTLLNVIRILTYNPHTYIPQWNDKFGRTKEEVVAMFKEVIKELNNV